MSGPYQKSITPLLVIGLILALTACVRPASQNGEPWDLGFPPGTPSRNVANATPTPFGPEAPEELVNIVSPTPNPPADLPDLREDVETYIVQPGDTLMRIALLYSVSVEQIIVYNQLTNPDYLEVGQILQIPAPAPLEPGPAFKIIPNSELIDGPTAADFNVSAFVKDTNGYLRRYNEVVDGVELSGADIIARISHDFSINPRLLLTLLEYQSNWLTKNNPDERKYPIGLPDPNRDSLYRQLSWAADNLNQGYYLWRVNALPAFVLADGSLVPANPTINEATAGIQYFFSRLFGLDAWRTAVSEKGLAATYEKLFGYAFQNSHEPILPENLKQPDLQLPFEEGVIWNFTGGPHGGWADGSAWAALDFAPPGEALGCVESSAWVVAVADGIVTHTGDGQVLLDLGEDGNHHTGWAVFYMHIDSHERVTEGSVLRAGDRIGHPSCEGGFSTGTHLHIARKYNGEWIPADQGDLPFVMDGWTSYGSGYVYEGWLQKGNRSVIADNGRTEENEIVR